MSAAPNGKKENILTSWKEIAAYLDRDVRTCVRWEQRYGLPVHRLDRDSKGKVFAYKEQIDQWLAERSAQAAQTDDPAACELPVRSRFKLFPVLFALAGLAAAVYFLFIHRPGGAGVPADFRIAGSELVVVDAKGHELWRHDTGLSDLESDENYHSHSKGRTPSDMYIPMWAFILFRDIDGDGRMETLFTVKTASDMGEGMLICFDASGKERWKFPAGRELTFGGRPYHREYRIFGFDIDDYDGDGKSEVLVISFHMPDWPCQVAMLDEKGGVEGEYWNAGYIMDASAGDLDGDGVKELVLGGVNNEYRRGCVAVFKPGQLRGGSPQTSAAFLSPDIGPGGQSVYVLLPNVDVHQARKQQGDPANYFWIRDGDGLMVMTTDTLNYYDLDRSLTCRNVILSSTFQNDYADLVRQGVVLPEPNETYRKSLESSLLYFRDGRWNVTPATDFAVPDKEPN